MCLPVRRRQNQNDGGDKTRTTASLKQILGSRRVKLSASPRNVVLVTEGMDEDELAVPTSSWWQRHVKGRRHDLKMHSCPRPLAISRRHVRPVSSRQAATVAYLAVWTDSKGCFPVHVGDAMDGWCSTNWDQKPWRRTWFSMDAFRGRCDSRAFSPLEGGAPPFTG